MHKQISRGEYAAVEYCAEATYPPQKNVPESGPLKSVKPDAYRRLGRVPTTEEARNILSRFCNSHFDNPGQKARMSIQARPDFDDDILMAAFIRWAEERDICAKALEDQAAEYWMEREENGDMSR